MMKKERTGSERKLLHRIASGLTAASLMLAAGCSTAVPLQPDRPEAENTVLPEPSDTYTFETEDTDQYGSVLKARGYLSETDGESSRYIICSGQKATGGYGIQVVSVAETGDGQTCITVKESEPGNETVTCAVTYPCITVTVHPAVKEVTVVNTAGAVFECLDNQVSLTDAEVRRAMMVDSVLYVDTGFVSSFLRCGNMDGYITDVTDSSRMPVHDGEANFESSGWQITGENSFDVLIDGTFHVFVPEETESDFAEEVQVYMAVVEELSEDGRQIIIRTDPSVSVPENSAVQPDSRYTVSAAAYDPGIYADTPIPGGAVFLICKSAGTFSPNNSEDGPLQLTGIYKLSPIGSQPCQPVQQLP